MTYLVLSIGFAVSIFLLFRAFPIWKIDTFQAIVFNYVTCVVTGSFFIGFDQMLQSKPWEFSWLLFALGLGFVFIMTFNLMAKTTQILGVSVASVASKIALVIPVLFSIFILEIELQNIKLINIFGILIAIGAIVLCSIKPNKQKRSSTDRLKWFLLPFLVFILSGLIDLSLNTIKEKSIAPGQDAVFSVYLFLGACIFGLIIMIFKRNKIQLKNIIAGIILGVPNYFSIYFLLLALEAFNNNGAYFFPIYNVGIIILSAILGVIIFKEQLSKVNIVGIILAVLGVYLISN